MTDESPLPEEYWIIDTGESLFRVDEETKMMVEEALLNDSRMIDFLDLSGAKVTIVLSKVIYLSNSTRAIREVNYQHRKYVSTEFGEDKNWD